jgi:fluoride ion exporter CrcB/FEX
MQRHRAILAHLRVRDGLELTEHSRLSHPSPTAMELAATAHAGLMAPIADGEIVHASRRERSAMHLLLIGVGGFVGAYTTFSTLALESWRLLEDGSWVLAAGNLAGSIVLGVVAVAAGISLGRAL